MKREFLQNFKVGELPLPKEIIDAILDENGRDRTTAGTAFQLEQLRQIYPLSG